MSKRKEIDDNESPQHYINTKPQKVNDFHKKTIDIHPSRLHELNHQFVSSITSQLSTEPYSVLVGNCLNYVQQYFVYEDDLLKESPWLTDRLKQSRSNIVNCLQETIDIYEALGNQDFSCLFDTQFHPSVSSSVVISTSSSQKISIIEENAHESNEPDIVEHEIDAKLVYRCRMEVNKSGHLITLGRVQVILKETNGKHQLIVRSDDSLSRFYLNISWLKKIEIKQSSNQDIIFSCQLNPSISGVKQGEFVMILFRFDNEKERKNAYDNLEKEGI